MQINGYTTGIQWLIDKYLIEEGQRWDLRLMQQYLLFWFDSRLRAGHTRDRMLNDPEFHKFIAGWCAEYRMWAESVGLDEIPGYYVEEWGYQTPPSRYAAVLFRAAHRVANLGDHEDAARIRRRALDSLAVQYEAVRHQQRLF